VYYCDVIYVSDVSYRCCCLFVNAYLLYAYQYRVHVFHAEKHVVHCTNWYHMACTHYHHDNKQVLPHVGVTESEETEKGFFMGYVVHKLLMCSLNRLEEDDRDHYGKKRLDLAGPLVAGLFRTLFRTLTKVSQ
jgi:DNA-directed RNA polymerase beta subunit